MTSERILITGGGGREHAIGWKLSQSEDIGNLFFSPGNAGTELLGNTLDIQFENPASLLKVLEQNKIDRIIVGPESHLALGIVNTLQKEGFAVFGPTKEAARLETDKAWAVKFMEKYDIPHPKTFIPYDYKSALDMAMRRHPGEIVIKATGPAQGKGVLLPESRIEAESFINTVYKDKKYGEAQEVIIQQRLEGKEISFLVFSDGIHTVPLLPARDYKRIGDNDTGPNTGGMGSFAPREMDKDLWNEAMQKIINPTILGMRKEGHPFKGILYAGLMATGDGLKVIEYNARFGDPETQSLMMLLESDLLQIIQAVDTQTLSQDLVRFKNGSSVCVVLAAAGYPENTIIGQSIKGFDRINNPNIQIFHSGTKNQNGITVVDGGRVVGITSYGINQSEAKILAYEYSEKIKFEGKQIRTDIAE